MKRRDIREEISHHLECETGKRGGAGAAKAVFGAPDRIEEEVRDARSRRWLETLWRDFRLALRGLRHAPAFTATAVLTLALGICANTAIFTWVNAELLAALPFVQASRLVFIREIH
ncbi:MAG: ABC transporter permease, partial [Terriglobales bacterium]